MPSDLGGNEAATPVAVRKRCTPKRRYVAIALAFFQSRRTPVVANCHLGGGVWLFLQPCEWNREQKRFRIAPASSARERFSFRLEPVSRFRGNHAAFEQPQCGPAAQQENARNLSGSACIAHRGSTTFVQLLGVGEQLMNSLPARAGALHRDLLPKPCWRRRL